MIFGFSSGKMHLTSIIIKKIEYIPTLSNIKKLLIVHILFNFTCCKSILLGYFPMFDIVLENSGIVFRAI